MEQAKRIGLISKIVCENPGFGKTAIMKFMYLLQQVYKVPLGYDYSIYTYGPYSSTVMADVDRAEFSEVIDVKREVFENGHSHYCITPASNARKCIDEVADTVNEYEVAIKEMLSLFGKKSAKDLELLTTIIYVYNNFASNNWDMAEVLDTVHDVKPYFSLETISFEYNSLDGLGILEEATA